MVLPARIVLAERIASIARELGIETALIGAVALAFHNFVRATNDVYFASSVDPYRDLTRLRDRLETDGYHTQLNFPDDEDSLGGLLRIWEAVDDDDDPIDPIEIVNFVNPHRPVRLPADEIVQNAVPIDDRPSLRCVQLPHLVMMKLYAGGPHDLADAAAVLARNPETDFETLRASCKRYGLDAIDDVIAQARYAIEHGQIR